MLLKRLERYFLPGVLKYKTLLVFAFAERCIHMLYLSKEKNSWREIRRQKVDITVPFPLLRGEEEGVSSVLKEFAVSSGPCEAVVVLLAPELFQVKTFPFPRLNSFKVRKALSFELEEYFPQLGPGAIFDFEVVKKDKRGQEIRVMAVAPKLIEDILALFSQAGIGPQFIKGMVEEIDFSAADYLTALLRNLETSLVLFPHRNRLFFLLSLERAAVASWVAVFVISLLIFSFVELRGVVLERRILNLRKTLAKLKPEAAETIKLKEGLAYLKEKEEAVFAAASSLEKQDAVLKNIAYVIPEGVWIRELRSDVFSGEVVIEGLSEDSEGVNDFMFALRKHFLIVNLKVVKEEMQGAQVMQEFKIVLQGERGEL